MFFELFVLARLNIEFGGRGGPRKREATVIKFCRVMFAFALSSSWPAVQTCGVRCDRNLCILLGLRAGSCLCVYASTDTLRPTKGKGNTGSISAVVLKVNTESPQEGPPKAHSRAHGRARKGAHREDAENEAENNIATLNSDFGEPWGYATPLLSKSYLCRQRSLPSKHWGVIRPRERPTSTLPGLGIRLCLDRSRSDQG